MRHGKRLMQVFLLALLTLAFAVQAQAANPDYFYKNLVDINYVKPLVKVPNPEGVKLIDSRPYQGKYIQGYIPTATSIPDTEFDKKTDLLPKDKNTTLVFYCEGPECKLSHNSARKAEKLGYKNVKVFPGGYPEWVKAGNYPAIGVEVLKEMISKGENFLLVDSRPLVKFLEGSIPSAVSIPDTTMEKKLGLLPADKSALLVFFCGGYDCPLSHKGALKAMSLGYTNVKVCEAGYPAWEKLYGSSGAVKVQSGGVEGAISVEQFKKILAEKPGSIMLIDVRDPDEFAKGHSPSAINIPVGELEKKLPGMKVDKPVVFVCATGSRSGEAYYMTRDVRKDLTDVFYLEATTKWAKDGACEITDNKKK